MFFEVEIMPNSPGVVLIIGLVGAVCLCLSLWQDVYSLKTCL